MESTDTLAGLVAVVTGATQGIGRAIALEFAAAGADVAVHAGHRLEQAAATERSIKQLGRDSCALLADLADPEARVRCVDTAWQWRNGVDIWVNNAGADVLTGTAGHATFDEKLARLWQVDVLGTIGLSRDVGARMRQRRRGVILNVGWDQAEQGMEGDSGEMFAAIKGAVMAFTRSLAKSLAPHVRVNCLAPGWIRTEWGERASDYWQQRAQAESLRQRWGTPQDVAQAARFLASPQADFITGLILPVNGGWSGSGWDRRGPTDAGSTSGLGRSGISDQEV